MDCVVAKKKILGRERSDPRMMGVVAPLPLMQSEDHVGQNSCLLSQLPGHASRAIGKFRNKLQPDCERM